MDWSKGFSAEYELVTVDRDSWEDNTRLEFMSGSIDRVADSELMESATITVTENIGEAWLRIYLVAHQNGGFSRTPLFTGLASSPERKIDGSRVSWDCDCYSVLKPAGDVLLERGYYAPAGSGADLARQLLSVSPCPVSVEGMSPLLSSSIVAEDGETCLSMATKVINALGWRIRISGDGSVVLCEMGSESKAVFGSINDDSIELDITDTNDWYSCPNVYRVSGEEYGTAVVRDNSPDSQLSTVNRGREIWQEETGVVLNGRETLVDYAARRLRECQSPSQKLNYNRRFYEDVTVGDIIGLNYPMHDLVGNYRITSQSIELGYGCRTTEEAVRIE